MLAGSASTSMRGAFMTPQIRPNIREHQAPQHSLSAGQRDAGAEAKAALSETSMFDRVLDVGLDLADAYLKFKRADEEAQSETMYLEYRERMTQWNVDKQMSTKTYDEDTGKFGWETMDKEYEEESRKVWSQLEKKYKIVSTDLRHDLDIKRRQNDLTQVTNIQEGQNKHRLARIEGNYEIRKNKAYQYGTKEEFKAALDWGLENGQFRSVEEYNLALENTDKAFATRDMGRLLPNMGVGSVGALLRELDNPESAKKKYGADGMEKLYKGAIARQKENWAGVFAANVQKNLSRTAIADQYNQMKEMTPEQLGVANEIQKGILLEELRGVKTDYETGLAKVTKESKAQAKKNHYDAKAQSLLINHRREVPLITNAEDTDLLGISDNQVPLVDPVTGEKQFEINVLTEPWDTYKQTSFDDDELAGLDRTFEREFGEGTVDKEGNVHYDIDPNDPRVAAGARESFEVSNGTIPKSYLDAAIPVINGNDRIAAADAALKLAAIVESDSSGKALEQIKGEKPRAMIASILDQSNDYTNPQQLAENIKQQFNTAPQAAQQWENDWDTNYAGDKPQNNVVEETLTKKLEELNIEVPPSQAMLDDMHKKGRNIFSRGEGLGDFGRTAVITVESTMRDWSLEPVRDTSTDEVKMVWRNNSFYAEVGDQTGTSVEVRDKMNTAAYMVDPKASYEDINARDLRPVYQGVVDGKRSWYMIDRNAKILVHPTTRQPILVNKNSPAMFADTRKQVVDDQNALNSANTTVAGTANLIHQQTPLGSAIEKSSERVLDVAGQGVETTVGVLEGIKLVYGDIVDDVVNYMSEFHFKDFKEKQAKEIGKRISKYGAGGLDASNWTDERKAIAGSTAYSLHVNELTDLLEKNIITRDDFADREAAMRKSIEGAGLIIPE